MRGARTLGLALALGLPAAAPAPAGEDPPSPRLVPLEPVARTLPPFFEENRGQAPEDLLFVGRSQDGMVGIRSSGVLLGCPGSLEPFAVGYQGGVSSRPVPEIPLPTRASYFLGGKRTVRAGGIPAFGAVRQPGVWPGVDLAWTYGDRGPVLEVRLAPGVGPEAVRLALPEGVEASTEAGGDLVLRRKEKDVLGKPTESGFRLRAPAGTGFPEIGKGLLGLRGPRGAGGEGTVLAIEVQGLREESGSWLETACGAGVAPDGTVVLAGGTSALALPGFGNPSADPRLHGHRGMDVFVARVDPSGTVLRSLSVYGGGSGETPRSMAVGPDGSVAVVGHTLSMELPTSPGAFQPGPLRAMGSFVVKFAPGGESLAFASWLGGSEARDSSDGTAAWAVAMDGSGAVFVAGEGFSYDFPFRGIEGGTDLGPVQPADRNPRRGSPPRAFLAKIRPDGRAVDFLFSLVADAYATPMVLAVDLEGGAWIAGYGGGERFPRVNPLPGKTTPRSRSFLLRVAPDGRSLSSAGLLPCAADVAPRSLLVDRSGSPLLVGGVRGEDFPVERPAMSRFDGPDWDLFVTRFLPRGNGYRHSSYLGFGFGNTELGASAALDPEGRAVVAGSTTNLEEWQDTPMEKRYLVLPRWFFTVWSPEGALLRTADVDLGDRPALEAFVAVGGNGCGYLGGILRFQPDDPLAPFPRYVRDQAFVLPLDVAGRGLFPEPPADVEPRFRMRPVGRRLLPGAGPTPPVAGGGGKEAGGKGTGEGAAGVPSAGEGEKGPAGDGEEGGGAGVSSGLLIDRPRGGADRIRLEGRLDAARLEDIGGFDPATDSLQLLLGSPDAPFLFRIPAGDPGWRRWESGRLEWRSSPGDPASGRVGLFPDRGTFFVRLFGFDFPGPQANPIRVVLEGRRPFAGGEAVWRSLGEGVFRYPE